MADQTQPQGFKDIEKMRRGRRAYETFTFPFSDVEVSIRLLSQLEYMVCEDEGKKMANERLDDPTPEQTEYFTGYFVLNESCYKPPEAGQDILQAPKFFESVDAVARLQTDELSLMVEYYGQVREKYSVYDQFNKPEEFAVLIEEVKKNSILGMSLSSLTLKKLLLYSVNADWKTLRKDSGLSSTPSNSSESKQNESTSEPSSEMQKEEITPPQVGVQLVAKS